MFTSAGLAARRPELEAAAEMARLVAVCRDGEEEFPFEKRQIPLYIDDTLTVSPRGPGAPLSPQLQLAACCNPQARPLPRTGLAGSSLAPAALILGTLQHLGLRALNVATFFSFNLIPSSKNTETA